MRVLIVGASGSGTTTLGRAVATRLNWTHIDLDDYYWVPTVPPFRQKRDPTERVKLLLRDMGGTGNALVSGSLVGWGEEVESAFDLVVFLYLPAAIRVERLCEREIERYGRADPAFLEWASQYDEGPPEGRSLSKHLAWLAGRKCPVLRIEGDLSVEQRMLNVLDAIRRIELDEADPNSRP